MNDSITYLDLEHFLLGLGFTRHRDPESHVCFDHKPSGAVVIVEDYAPDMPVPGYKLVAARASLHHFGVLDRDRFDAMLEKSLSATKAG